MRKGSEELREQWRKRLSEFDASGLSAAQFAKEQGLHPKALYYWKQRLSPKGITKRSRKSASAVGFVKLRGKEVKHELELACGAGYWIRVSEDFNEDTLNRVLKVLEAKR